MTEHGKIIANSLSPNTSNAQTDTIEIDFNFPNISTSPAPSSVPVTLPSFDDVLLDWPTDLNEQQGNTLDNNYTFENGSSTEISGLPSSNEQQSQLQSRQQPQQQLSPVSQPRSYSISFSGVRNDYHISNIDLSESLSPSSPSCSRHFQEQTSFPIKAPQRRRHTESGNDSQCVLVCSQMIISLEKYLMDDLKVFDLILGIVKRVIDNLSPLVGGQGSRNSKCLALFSTIMYQIIELLEAGCSNFLAEELDDNMVNGQSNHLGGSLHGHDLGFGAFCATSVDRRRFRAQIVLRKLHPIAELTRKVALLCDAGWSNGYNPRSSTSQERAGTGYRRDLEPRLKLLIERVRRGGGL
jgi:hypothetical protein